VADRNENEKNILILTARVEGVPVLGETTDRRDVCDVPLFIPNGRYRSFKMVASVFDGLAFIRAAELTKGMEVLFVGHLRGFRTWRDRKTGRWIKSWFSGTGDIFPLAGLPDLSSWPMDPLNPLPAAGASASPDPQLVPGATDTRSGTAPLVAATRSEVRPTPAASGRQLDFSGTRTGQYGDPSS
jgi:hypothetical protein